MGDILLEDIYEITHKDPDGKRFDKVSRFVCKSEVFEFELTLDVNIDIYPLKAGEKFTMALARTVHKDGTAETGTYDAAHPIVSGKASLMDAYEYVMYGTVYKFQGDKSGAAVRVEVYASFGGLLMRLVGDPTKLKALSVDDRIYLLMRRL